VLLDCVIYCAFYSILFRGAVFFRSRCIADRCQSMYILPVGRCQHFQRGRRNYTRSCLTHAICCWRRRNASRCLSSTWRNVPRRNDVRNATSWRRGKISSDNFLKKHISPASTCAHSVLSCVSFSSVVTPGLEFSGLLYESFQQVTFEIVLKMKQHSGSMLDCLLQYDVIIKW